MGTGQCVCLMFFPLLISAFQLGVGGRPHSSISLCSPPCHLHTDGTVRTWQTEHVLINKHTHTEVHTCSKPFPGRESVPTGCLHPHCYSSVDLISGFRAEGCGENRSEKQAVNLTHKRKDVETYQKATLMLWQFVTSHRSEFYYRYSWYLFKRNTAWLLTSAR